MRVFQSAAAVFIVIGPFCSSPPALASRPPKPRPPPPGATSAAVTARAAAFGSAAGAGSAAGETSAALIAIGTSGSLSEPAHESGAIDSADVAAGGAVGNADSESHSHAHAEGRRHLESSAQVGRLDVDHVDEDDPAIRETALAFKDVEGQLDKALADINHQELNAEQKKELVDHVKSKMMGVDAPPLDRSPGSWFDKLMAKVSGQIGELGTHMAAAHQGLKAWRDSAVKLAEHHREMQQTGDKVTQLSQKTRDGVDEAHHSVADAADAARQVVDEAAQHIVAEEEHDAVPQ